MDSLPSRVLYLSLTRVCVFPWILYHVNDPLPGFRRWHVKGILYYVSCPDRELAR